MQIQKFCLILLLLCLSFSCKNNSIEKHTDEIWFVKFQTGILAGKCYHMYNNKITTSDGTITLQNRSSLPVTVTLSDHSVTRKKVFRTYLIPGQIQTCKNLNPNIEYCVSLIIDDGYGAKNGVIAVYGDANIVPFSYIEANEEKSNSLINFYNKLPLR